MFRSSHLEVFLGIGVQKICRRNLQEKFTGEIAIRHEYSPVNLLLTFRTPFLKSSSGCSIFMNYCSSKIHQHMVFNFKTQKQSKDYSKQRLLQFTSVLQRFSPPLKALQNQIIGQQKYSLGDSLKHLKIYRYFLDNIHTLSLAALCFMNNPNKKVPRSDFDVSYSWRGSIFSSCLNVMSK